MKLHAPTTHTIHADIAHVAGMYGYGIAFEVIGVRPDHSPIVEEYPIVVYPCQEPVGEAQIPYYRLWKV